MTRTFLDSGVLLTAWKGTHSAKALTVIADTAREFVTCQMVRLELIPKAYFQKQSAEQQLYELYFSNCLAEEPLSLELGNQAFALAKKYGLAAADAINAASAIRQGAREFVTSELPGKPLFRIQELSVISLALISS